MFGSGSSGSMASELNHGEKGDETDKQEIYKWEILPYGAAILREPLGSKAFGNVATFFQKYNPWAKYTGCHMAFIITLKNPDNGEEIPAVIEYGQYTTVDTPQDLKDKYKFQRYKGKPIFDVYYHGMDGLRFFLLEQYKDKYKNYSPKNKDGKYVNDNIFITI